MRDLIRMIAATLEGGEDLVLATIVDSSGSTPRASGAKMAVRRDGGIAGTVGGGLVEAMTQRAAAELFGRDGQAARLLTHDLDNELAARSDMICGGRVTLLLERLPADGPREAFALLDDALRRGRAGTLGLVLEMPDGESGRVLSRTFLAADAGDAARDVPAALRAEALDAGRPALRREEGRMLVAEPFFPRPTAYIFGAGHVSRPTAQVARIAGFRTVVLDDRAEFANRERFPDADEVLTPPSLDSCLQGLDVGPADALVIVTRGHLHDKTVLAQALETPAGYVGMIGSRRKRDAIYDALRAEGVGEEAIARCRCPIGLAIGARTPEEIAVSIVAELVQWRTAAESGGPA